MANDLKSGIGYLIPAAGFIGFVTSLVLEMYLLSIILAVASILAWFLYMLVMESGMPSLMGNMILLFGILLSVGIFMGFGVKPNMWGGIEFQTEGSIFALVILFFSVLMGLSYRNLSHRQAASTIGSGLSGSDRDLVLDAINFANKGHHVTAVDFSKYAITNMNKNAKNKLGLSGALAETLIL